MGKKKTARNAICLFSSAGVGELGLREASVEVLVANELLPSRAALYRENFGDHVIQGDIRKVKGKIIQEAKQRLGSGELFLLYATPPCQGMSSNGLGKLNSEAALGRRSQDDERNRLIIPAMDIAAKLKPRWVLLENVPGMERTEILTTGARRENIIEYVKRRLGKEYVGCAEVIACEDFGIPQRRRRLITIFTRDTKGREFFNRSGETFFPDSLKEDRRTLRQAIGHLPPLDARHGRNAAVHFHPYHSVSVMSELKYSWVEHTKEGSTAFNNQCINPTCRSTRNPGHSDIKLNGKWVSSKDIPIHCVDCGSLLPRPHVIEGGKPRLLKGFHSAYRRMKWDEPARTITQNFLYEASDNKIHPDQNRVLSVYEAMILQTLDRYEFDFSLNGKRLSNAQIAEVIGESVPPYLIQKIAKMMLDNSSA